MSVPIKQIVETKILRVDAGGRAEFSTISAAITAASAGDTILVYPGGYAEQLAVTKNLSIVGMGAATDDRAVTNTPQVIIEPTLSVASDIAIDCSSVVTSAVLANIHLRYKADVIIGLTQGIRWVPTGGGNLVLDNCIVSAEVIGTGGGQGIQAAFIGGGVTAQIYNTVFAVDDPSVIITTGSCAPLTLFGTNHVSLLSGVTSRDGDGGTCFGEVSLQTNAVSTWRDCTVDDEVSDVGGTTTLNLDTPCRIGNLTTTGTINHRYRDVVWRKGADIASATALALGTDGNYFDVTGTTTITSVSAAPAGFRMLLQFDGVVTVTHHATNLILAGGTNFVTAAGDHLELVSYDGTNWREVSRSTAPGGGGGDNISVNGVAATDADFDDATPAAPAGSKNVTWQKDTSAPDNISAHVTEATVTARGVVELATQAEVNTGTDTVRAVTPATLAGTPLKPILSKSITIESPTASEDLSIFFTNLAITVTEMRAVVRGSTPSVTWTVRHGTSRSAAGAQVVTGGTATTSQTTGSDVTSFNDATIVADSFVWLETTAQTGTVDEISITIVYTED